MTEWTEKWLMVFNMSKCKYMRIGNTEVPEYQYSIGDTRLEETVVERNIGVLVDNKLRFSEHIAEKVNKANGVLGIIRRN